MSLDDPKFAELNFGDLTELQKKIDRAELRLVEEELRDKHLGIQGLLTIGNRAMDEHVTIHNMMEIAWPQISIDAFGIFKWSCARRLHDSIDFVGGTSQNSHVDPKFRDWLNNY